MDHWDDVVSDLSAIHRKCPEDFRTARELWACVDRLPHYPGALRDVVLHALQQDRRPPSSALELAHADEPAAADTVPELGELTEHQVQQRRDAARLKRFPPAKYGEHKTTGIEQALTGATDG